MKRPWRRGSWIFVAVLVAATAATALLPGEYKIFPFLLMVFVSLIYGVIEVGGQLTKDARWLGRWIRKQLRRQQDNSQP